MTGAAKEERPSEDVQPTAMDRLAAYNAELRRVTEMMRPLMPMIATIDVELLRDGRSLAQTLGPMFAPSEWMRGGDRNLDDQAAFIRAVGPLVAYARDGLRAAAARAGGGR